MVDHAGDRQSVKPQLCGLHVCALHWQCYSFNISSPSIHKVVDYIFHLHSPSERHRSRLHTKLHPFSSDDDAYSLSKP